MLCVSMTYCLCLSEVRNSNYYCCDSALQRTIDALKLKNVIERDTLNDMHMKTIRVRLQKCSVWSDVLTCVCCTPSCTGSDNFLSHALHYPTCTASANFLSHALHHPTCTGSNSFLSHALHHLTFPGNAYTKQRSAQVQSVHSQHSC